jgi:hypothetical protein
MLKIDLDSPDASLSAALTRLCSRWGEVTRVGIYRSLSSYTFALVDMSNASQVGRVLAEVGDMPFGSAALIKLVHGEGLEGTN